MVAVINGVLILLQNTYEVISFISTNVCWRPRQHCNLDSLVFVWRKGSLVPLME